jgi:hypothetical protein
MDNAANILELPEYPHYVARLCAELPELAAEVVDFTGVEHVLIWMQRRGLIGASVDIVGQDEFNYDFLVEWEQGGRWLAFGVT